MRFYSGKGDGGITTLFNGKQIAKNDPVLELIGSIDELNAIIGLARSKTVQTPINADLKTLQGILSNMMGLIAGATDQALPDLNLPIKLVWLEEHIDELGEKIDLPEKFTFPGESDIGAIFDICRTVSRRTERLAVSLFSDEKNATKEIIAFLNRLSSYFYVLRLQFEK